MAGRCFNCEKLAFVMDRENYRCLVNGQVVEPRFRCSCNSWKRKEKFEVMDWEVKYQVETDMQGMPVYCVHDMRQGNALEDKTGN